VLALSEAGALIVGVGAVGAEIGRLLASFGTRVVGVDVRRTDPVDGFLEVLPAGELDEQLSQADVVILSVPHTPQTEGMINAERLAKLRSKAYFVNVGRGPTVHLGALVDALDQGRLAGVALDVFDEEPLPAACRMSLAIASGCVTSDRWPASTSMVVAFMRWPMRRRPLRRGRGASAGRWRNRGRAGRVDLPRGSRRPPAELTQVRVPALDRQCRGYTRGL
jgi:lactate dehydrogenase-like 2-hydroxyacid dehydrogenase